MVLPLSKPCPHIVIQTIVDEQPYFDGVLSEIAYHSGVYECNQCLERVYYVDGHWFTAAERDAYYADADNIPF